MTSTKTRRAASVALVGAALVGLQTASAIGADLDGRDLFVGADSVDTCSSSAITVDYDVDYDSDLQGYGVSAAELSGFDAQCQGYDLIVSLNGPGGVPLAEMTSAVEATRVRVAVPAGTPVAAEQLTGVSVVLRGGGA